MISIGAFFSFTPRLFVFDPNDVVSTLEGLRFCRSCHHTTSWILVFVSCCQALLCCTSLLGVDLLLYDMLGCVFGMSLHSFHMNRVALSMIWCAHASLEVHYLSADQNHASPRNCGAVISPQRGHISYSAQQSTYAAPLPYHFSTFWLILA